MALQYDMFEERSAAKAPAAEMSEADMVRYLQATGQYRILTKLQPRQVVEAPDPAYPLRGIILDTETTGLNACKHEIIEIGIIAFSFDQRGTIGDVTAVYGGLQEPTSPIPADITRLTGLTDAMVAGQAIDLVEVEALIEPAGLVVAHNAGFDRPFCEIFSPVFANTALSMIVSRSWKCSPRKLTEHRLPNCTGPASARVSASLPSTVRSTSRSIGKRGDTDGRTAAKGH